MENEYFSVEFTKVNYLYKKVSNIEIGITQTLIKSY